MCITDGFASPHEPKNHQRVINQDFPRLAYLFEDQPPIDVQVWIEWERDGGEWVDGTATRWSSNFVFVGVDGEERLDGIGVWVKPYDVRRRAWEKKDRTPPPTPRMPADTTGSYDERHAGDDV
jgi:hypothetical protein